MLTNQKWLQEKHRQWVDTKLLADQTKRSFWSNSIAIGSKEYIEKIKQQLDNRARTREFVSNIE